MHPLLVQDMEMVRSMYGENSLSCRTFETIDDIDVELLIGLDFLDVSFMMHKRSLTTNLHSLSSFH